MHTAGPGLRRPEAGIVLVAVLWIIAALSIIVTGVSQSMRNEVRLAAAAKQAVLGNATADAAFALVLQDLASRNEKPGRMSYVETQYRGLPVRVQVTPLTGLIDINNAPAPLLAALFSVAGNAPAQAAASLADATIETRSSKDRRGALIAFEAVEDLLRVPGIDYDLYAKIAPLVTADIRGNGRVNPMAAPEDVLMVLANGDGARAARLAADRDAGQTGIDTTSLNGAYIDTASSPRVRLVARVPLPDGGWLLASRSVDLESGAQDGLPWRDFQASYRFEPAPGQRN